MFVFFGFVLWVWVLITIFVDIFRSRDIGGFAKALPRIVAPLSHRTGHGGPPSLLRRLQSAQRTDNSMDNSGGATGSAQK